MKKIFFLRLINQHYNLRARIILSFTLLSFICAFTYGFLSKFIYDVVNDQLFNWHAIESSHIIKQQGFYPSNEKNRYFLIGEDEELHAYLRRKFDLQETFSGEGFSHMNALDHKEILDDDQIIYEFSIHQKKLHVVSIPRGKQRQFLIYDISGFFEDNEYTQNLNDRQVLWLTLPLTLLITAIGILLGIVLSKHVISPISKLAENVENIDPENPNPCSISEKYVGEIGTLANTMQSMMLKINQFVDHERQFSREVSHELRTPVTSIGIAIDLLKSTGIDEQQRNIINRINRAKKDMANLIQTFLMLGRDTIDESNATEITIKSHVDLIIEKNNYLLHGKDISVIVDIANHEKLHINENLFTVIISNLIRNSFQYTHNGSIHISGNSSHITIIDTGLGIPADELENICSAYKTLQSNGIGLGLSIVKRITQKIHWTVEIDSHENTGTTVIVTFSEKAIHQ